jgi:thiol-disulfide isomerase/thioredoxin
MSFWADFKQKWNQISLSDWAIAILLIIMITALVTWVHSDREGDNGMSEEGFLDIERRKQQQTQTQPTHCQRMAEHFADAPPKKSKKLSKLQQVDQDLTKDDVVLLFIHHTQCGHCHTFQPTWTRLCEKYQNTRASGNKTVTLYDINNEDNEALWNTASQRFGVEGYPTIMVLKHDGTKVVANEYSGPRDEFGVWCGYIEQQAV